MTAELKVVHDSRNPAFRFPIGADQLLDRGADPDVRLEAVIPCGSQPDRWNLAQRQRYNSLLDRCDKVTVLQIHYTPDCMLRRNRYMVEHSSLLLACYNGYPGGTQSTLLYAQRQGLQTIVIEI